MHIVQVYMLHRWWFDASSIKILLAVQPEYTRWLASKRAA